MNSDIHELAVLDKPPVIHFDKNRSARHEFMAWLNPEVFVNKLTNAIVELDAEILTVDENCIRVQVGSKSWLRRYTTDDMPAELTIRFNRDTACLNAKTHVIASIRPLGLVRSDAFELRCKFLVQSLRACLLGEDLVRMDQKVSEQRPSDNLVSTMAAAINDRCYAQITPKIV